MKTCLIVFKDKINVVVRAYSKRVVNISSSLIKQNLNQTYVCQTKVYKTRCIVQAALSMYTTILYSLSYSALSVLFIGLCHNLVSLNKY